MRRKWYAQCEMIVSTPQKLPLDCQIQRLNRDLAIVLSEAEGLSRACPECNEGIADD